MTWPLAPLPWQQPSWEKLGQSLQGQRFPHALLVTGSAGIGKLHFCRALSALLLCREPAAGTACGNCRSCVLLEAGTHSDLLDLGLDEGSRQLKVDQVRQLGEFLSKTASLGENKLVVLNPADAMNASAANALLKNLEEPTANTYLLLVSANLSRIMPTVRSRCQNIAMPDPTESQCAQWVEQFCGDGQLAQALLEHSQGKPLLAQRLFESDQLAHRQSLVRGLDALAEGSISPLEFSPLVADEDLEVILGVLSAKLEGVIRERIQAGNRSMQRQFQVLDDLQLLRRRVSAGGNPNRQLCIESAAMQLAQVLGDEP